MVDTLPPYAPLPHLVQIFTDNQYDSLLGPNGESRALVALEPPSFTVIGILNPTLTVLVSSQTTIDSAEPADVQLFKHAILTLVAQAPASLSKSTARLVFRWRTRDKTAAFAARNTLNNWFTVLNQ